MKKTILSFVAIIVFALFANAQPSAQWHNYYGGLNSDVPNSAHQTFDGGYIIVGISNSQDFDFGSYHGGYDLAVVKTNASGDIQWQKLYGGSNGDGANSVQQTSDGGFIIAGYSSSNDGDLTTNNGNEDFWIIKIDSTGNTQWQKSYGGTQIDNASSIQQTSDGGYIVGGRTSSFDGDVIGHHGTQYIDGWVLKLDISGLIQWQKCLGGSGGEMVNSVYQTSDGGYIVAGSASSTDGDVTGNHGGSDFWIVKLNPSGILQWQKSLGGSNGDQANSIQQTFDGGFIVAGYTTSNDGDVTFNHGGTNPPYYDYWVVKLDTSGTLQWQKSLGGTSSDRANCIRQTSEGGYIVAGETFSNDGDITWNYGNEDFWIVKLDTSGVKQWQKSIGGGGLESASFIQQVSDGGYFVVGSAPGIVGGDFCAIKLTCGDTPPIITAFPSTVVCIGDTVILSSASPNPNYWSTGYVGQSIIVTQTGNYTSVIYDTSGCSVGTTIHVFVIPDTVYANVIGCDSLVSNGQTYYTNGVYSQLLTNFRGCDSTFIFNLFIAHPSSGSITLTACDSLVLNQHTYNSSGVYVQTIPNVFGCDSILTVNLTVNYRSYDTVSLVACDTFTLNGQNYLSNGTYSQYFLNSLGCDSTYTFNLTIHHSNYQIWSYAVCDSFLLNSQLYTVSGNYIQTLVNASGCDSVLTFHLTLLYTEDSIAPIVCDSFSLNGQTYTSSGVYTQILTNVSGCDSILKINLSVNAPDISVAISENNLFSNALSSTYQWLDCNLSQDTIQGETNSAFYPLSAGSYSVIVNHLGCLDTSLCFNFSNYSDVWPGDANNDSVVNNNDILTIGLFYGQTGLVRSVTGNLWQADSAANWNISEINSSDIKHGDCNGDGIIDNNDTLAINLNFNLIHAIAPVNNDFRLTSPDLYFVTNNTSYSPGDTVAVEVWAGSSIKPISNLYGLSFNINYTATLVQAGTESISYPPSWLGTPGIDAIKISKVDALVNTGYAGISRINHTNASGFGKIADFKFQTNAAISSTSVLHIYFSNYVANDSAGVPIIFNTTDDSLTIHVSGAGINEITGNSSISISPNPFTSATTITFSEEQKNTTVKITDVLGKEIKTVNVMGKQCVIEKGEMRAGVYLVRIMDEKRNVVNRKMVVE